MKPLAGPTFMAEPQPGCTVVDSPGGAGMTRSFGVAEGWWRQRERSPAPAAPVAVPTAAPGA